MHPVCVPVQLHPVCVPVQLHPVCVPVQLHPVCVPVQLHPVCVPVQLHPVCVPVQLHPVCVPVYPKCFIAQDYRPTNKQVFAVHCFVYTGSVIIQPLYNELCCVATSPP